SGCRGVSDSTQPVRVVNLAEMVSQIRDHWSPHVVGSLNGQEVRLAKLRGEFVWHHHEHEDELFLVVRGELEIRLRDAAGHTQSCMVRAGEFIIVPRGVEHLPVAVDEVEVLLFEPATTLNTGNVRNDRTKEALERI